VVKMVGDVDKRWRCWRRTTTGADGAERAGLPAELL